MATTIATGKPTNSQAWTSDMGVKSRLTIAAALPQAPLAPTVAATTVTSSRADADKVAFLYVQVTHFIGPNVKVTGRRSAPARSEPNSAAVGRPG
jgi:hypothetical protein